MILTPFDDILPVFGGLDLSSTTDLTAWAMVQKRESHGYVINCRFWIPRNRAVQSEKRDRVPYAQWADMGLLTLTDGDVVDYSVVERTILDDSERYNVLRVGYDPWNAEGTRQRLEAGGVEMIKVRQGFASLSEACKELEACVIAGTFGHGGNDILEWMAENVEVETDANGNIRPIKPKHGDATKRIDGIVACVTAMAVCIASPSAAQALDYYESHDLESF